MSSKKNKNSVSREESQNDIYRKNKKINKSKIKSGQMSKNFLNEDSLLNVLPSGAFDKKEEKNNKSDEQNKKEEPIKKEKIETINDKNVLDDDIEEEEFNESYFDQVPYTKK